MCRSQQVNEVVNENSSSEEECNLIQNFDSCEEFEIMSVENDLKSIVADEQFINNRVITNNQTAGICGQQWSNEKSKKVEKIEVPGIRNLTK